MARRNHSQIVLISTRRYLPSARATTKQLQAHISVRSKDLIGRYLPGVSNYRCTFAVGVLRLSGSPFKMSFMGTLMRSAEKIELFVDDSPWVRVLSYSCFVFGTTANAYVKAVAAHVHGSLRGARDEPERSPRIGGERIELWGCNLWRWGTLPFFELCISLELRLFCDTTMNSFS